MVEASQQQYLLKPYIFPDPTSSKWWTSPTQLNGQTFLNDLFDSSYLYPPNHLILRLVNRLYHIQHSKTKSEFINDPEIQKVFGTLDKSLLEEFYDFIKYNKDTQELDRFHSSFIADPSFIKGSGLETIQGEAAEKFAIHLLEKISASYLIVDGLLHASPIPSSTILNHSSDWSLPTPQTSGITGMVGKSDPILSESKLRDAINEIRSQSIDINSITSGTDRLTLILPRPLKNAANPLINRIQELTLLNTITEYKLKLSDKIDRRALLTQARKIAKGNENDRLILGRMEDYPPPIKSKTDGRVVVEGIGLGRIDRLERDWYKLKTSLGINSLFKLGGQDLDSSNCVQMATDEFRNALSTSKIHDIANTTGTNRIIIGIARKMENSIAQHQLIEFMRSGRWFAPKDLGIGFSPIKSSVDALNKGMMVQRNYADLSNVQVGNAIEPKTVILVPLVTPDGNQYNAIIERDTFFIPQQLTHSEFRFGITKYLDSKGIAQSLPNPDLFSIRVSRPTGKMRLNTIRKYQRKAYELLFSTPQQGHHANFILGTWMPEVSILVYAGATQNEVLKLLQMTQRDYPITYNSFQSFDISFLNLKWISGSFNPPMEQNH